MNLFRIAAAAAVIVGGSALGACATDNDVVRGAGLGAAGGAVLGAVVPGVSTVEGAAIGAAGGAVIGAINDDNDDRRNSAAYCRDRYPRGSEAFRRCRRGD